MEHYFYFERIKAPLKLEALYSLRYKVYCEERGFIPKEMCPDQRETDRYDDRSLHFGAYLLDGEVAGTVRLVKAPTINELPLFKRCAIDREALPYGVNGSNSAEISRLAVSKHMRRRRGDGTYSSDSPQTQPVSLRSGKRRVCPELILGLYKAMYHETKRSGIKYWFAAMEPSLAKLLSRFYFQFEEIGPEVDYYGLVRPYVASVEDIEWAVHNRDPDLLSNFTDGLEDRYMPHLTRQ